MKIGAILAGLIFLSNPNIGIIDVLPDFIGYLLIIHGLGVTTIIVPHFNGAARNAISLFIISTLKILCVPLLWRNIPSFPLVLSFSFGILELIFLIPMVVKLFDGLSYVGIRYGVSSILSYNEKDTATKDPSTKKTIISKLRIEKISKVKRATIIFLIYRTVVSIIPNLPDLQISEQSPKAGEVFLIKYSNLSIFILATTIIIGLLGTIVWMIKSIPFFLKILKDGGFKTKFISECNKKRDDPIISRNFKMIRIMVILGVTTVLSVFLILKGVNYILGAFPSALLIIISLLMIPRTVKRNLFILIPTIGCAVTSVLEFQSRQKYFIELGNDPEAALWSNYASKFYDYVKYYTLLDRLLLMISLLIVFVLIFRMWTKDFFNNSDSGDEDIYSTEKHHRVSIRFKIMSIIMIPLFILSAFEPWIIIDIDLISSILTILTLLWAIFAVFTIIDTTSERYSLKPYINK